MRTLLYYSPGYGGGGGYDYAPPPMPGQGPFGSVPGLIQPPDPFGDLSRVLPGLGGTNAAAMGDINAQLGGQLSPGTLKQMQDYEAQYAAGAGMPGANAMPGSLPYN